MKSKYRLIIAGGRDFNDYDFLKENCMSVIDKLKNDYDVIVVSGHAQGADMLGERLANEHGLMLEVYPADWKLHYRSAGFRRNEQMGDISDGLIAYWDGRSHGTRHMIEYAKSKGLDVTVYYYNFVYEHNT